jgi:hypothetical protein
MIDGNMAAADKHYEDLFDDTETCEKCVEQFDIDELQYGFKCDDCCETSISALKRDGVRQ